MTQNGPQIVVIAGPNGAGKSTVAARLLRDLFAVTEFVNADSIAQGLSAFDPEESAMAAGRIMLARLRELAERGEDFAFETTLASRSFAPWLADLTKAGHRFRLVYLWLPDAELAVSRVRRRVDSGGHDVPEETVRRRYARGLFNFFDLYRALADQWLVYDASGPVWPRLIASGTRGDTTRVFDADTWRTIQAQSTR